MAREARQQREAMEQKRREVESALAALEKTEGEIRRIKGEREKILAELRAQKEIWAQDILTLEEAWKEALPSLQLLLQKLPDLPWNRLQPGEVRIDPRKGWVLAVFRERDMERVLFKNTRGLENIKIKLEDGSMAIMGPAFAVRGELRISGPHHLTFSPRRVIFSGRPLHPSTWNFLLPQERLQFVLPDPGHGLKFQELRLKEGSLELVMVKQ
ncbi:MAG TPA: hypothetical protein ENM97_02200 [Moorella mulderi]|nr:hypothetical protein [Moorella mulderi]